MSTEHGVALITGAGRGLGRAFALALAERGFKVALTARTEAEINATADSIAHNGGRAIALPGDVADRQAVARAVALTEVELGPIDLLINNAGVLNGGLIGTIDADEMRRRSPDVAAWFEQLFAEGHDTPIERLVQLVVTLASGKADALSGCFLRVHDDLDALLVHADTIQSEERLRLRLSQ